MTSSFPLSLKLYALAARAMSPLVPALLAARARRGKEDGARLGERLGRASKPRPAGRLAWLHAVSVGESLSLLPLVDRLRAARKDLAILVTSGTRASAEVLARRLPAEVIHQYAPVDTPGAAARFLDHWRPDLAIFVESELWPNLILAAKARGARLALISASLSRRSYRSWRKVPMAARTILGAYDLVLARDADCATRLAALGARIGGLADLKFDGAAPPVDEATLAAIGSALDGRPVLLAASTHPGEEGPILRSFISAAAGRTPKPILIIAPRHPERGSAIEQLALSRGLHAGRRSDGAAPRNLAVYIADTVGEMGLWYRLARLALIGGSLTRGVGGHNPLEPARLGCPFVAGVHVERWPVYEELSRLGGTRLLSGAEIGETFRGALDRAANHAAMARTAYEFVAARDGQSQEAAARLIDLAAW
jgi:3-deoxy-D-manno-octulosonic-acid transferase